MSTASLERKLKAATRCELSLENLVKEKLEVLLTNYDPSNKNKLIAVKEAIEEKLKTLKSNYDDILGCIEDDTENLNYERKGIDLLLRYKEVILRVKDVLSEHESTTTTIINNPPPPANPSIKLPQMDIKKFHGDITQWQVFIDSFHVAVHDNPKLSEIEKMNYLYSLLTGDALKTVEGLKLSGDNYLAALSMLKERYGDKQVLISSHMNKLLNLSASGNKNDVTYLRELYNSIETQVRSLRSLEMDEKNYGPMLIPVIMNKLSENLKINITRQLGDGIWEIREFLNAFKKELSVLERLQLTQIENELSNENFISGLSLHTHNYQKADSKNHKCVFCFQNHKPQHCKVVTKVEERKNILQSSRRCFLCLHEGHVLFKCNRKYRCYKCNKRHHVSICDEVNENPERKNFSNNGYLKQQSQNHIKFSKSEMSDTSKKSIETQTNYSENKSDVLLQTAVANVYVQNKDHGTKFRLLFDSGSQLSYVSPRVQSILKPPIKAKKDVVLKTFGEKSETKRLDLVELTIESKTDDQDIKLQAFVSNICHPLKNQNTIDAASQFPHLKNLRLADMNNSPVSEVDILIGCDYYWQFMKNDVIRGDFNEPVAIATKLGFVLSGKVDCLEANSCTTQSTVTNVLRVQQEINESLDQTLNKFWEIENVGLTKEIDVCEKFNADIAFLNGRYEVKLPFKDEHNILNDNYYLCKCRLKNMVLNKFARDPSLFKTYKDIINEQFHNHIIEEAPDNYIVGETHYLPHKPVLREDRTTTKCRIVFDASAKTKDGISLNECLHTGPSLSAALYGVLLRFRLYNIVFVSDIEKAFLQILLHPSHRNYTRFLWFKNPEKIDFTNFEANELQEYRFCRVLFGLTSSPFLSFATMVHHLKKYNDVDNDFVIKILHSLHVDDLSSGAKTIEEAFDFYTKAKARFAEGGFHLRKFQSNSANLEDKVNKYEGISNTESKPQEKKILGMQWNKNTDKFIFDISTLRTKFTLAPTKRNVIKSVASVYDPLGLINPIVVKMKIFFQTLCKEKLNWDDPLEGNILKEWEEIVNSLLFIDIIEIERLYCFLNPIDPVIKFELHGFCDASVKAYGCCAYLRFVHSSHFIKTVLVCAKSRVAPIKQQSIPRLELLSCLLLAQLINTLVDELKFFYTNLSLFLWTDSSVAFSWIRNTHKTFPVFVQRRVSEIRRLVDISTFRLIASGNNPADIVSRGCTPAYLLQSDKWFSGPDFLRLTEENWPLLKVGEKFTNSKDDGKVMCVTVCSEESGNNMCDVTMSEGDGMCDVTTNLSVDSSMCDAVKIFIENIVDIKDYSSLLRLFRVTAYVCKFAKILLWRTRNKNIEKYDINDTNKKSIKWDGFKSIDIGEAKSLWIIATQRCLQAKEYDDVKKSLNIFQDEHSIFRCRGRLENSNLPYNTKYPIFIPSNSYLAYLLIRLSHENILHNGVRETMNDIRVNYWIPKLRQKVKTYINSCVRCKKFQGLPYVYPESPPLPKFRLIPGHSFSKIGIDYFGPVYIKNTNEMVKVWICLITCLTSRAIYLDIATSLSGISCVNILRRFSGRHGSPQFIISDNGSNFISKEVQSYATRSNITWQFNLEKAPWYGGVFERLIQSVKRCLRKVLNVSKVDYEQLLTILIEIQKVINNRPLTEIFNDNIGDQALTPNHLIYGRRLDSNYAGAVDKFNDNYQNMQAALTKFWNVWQTEYLSILRQQHQYRKHKSYHSRYIKIGDIVLIADKTPRIRWLYGRVTELIRSKDGNVRGASVLVKNQHSVGILRRPVNKLIHLESSAIDSIVPTIVDDTNIPMIQDAR